MVANLFGVPIEEDDSRHPDMVTFKGFDGSEVVVNVKTGKTVIDV
jgi:hypothetical protein